MQDSQQPDRLFRADTSYQDRPLYPVLSHFISLFIKVLVSGERVFINSSGEAIKFHYANLLAFWLIHFIVLFVALFLLLKSLNTFDKLATKSILAIVSLIFLNDVSKGFFWTPHTQIFSLFLAAFAIFSWQKFSFQALNTRFEIIWFITAALLIFFYPILAIALVIPVLANFRRYTVFSIIAIIPYLVYPTILQSLGGIYRNPQVEDANQFVWVFDPGMPALLVENFKLFLDSLSVAHLVLLLFLLTLLVLGRKTETSDVKSEKGYLVLYGFLLTYALFLYFLGTYVYRLPIPFLCMAASVTILIIAKRCSRTIQNAASSVALIFSMGLFFFTQGIIT
jgi:hypothetical protein